MHASALCCTIPLTGSFVYASTGQPIRQEGSRQWLHPIYKYKRCVSGYQPPSISPTRRQLISAGFPFCSLQATTQHLQPMHLVMSKWKRYCSPGPGGGGNAMLEPIPHNEATTPSAGFAAVVRQNSSSPAWARSSRGSSTNSSIDAQDRRRLRRGLVSGHPLKVE